MIVLLSGKYYFMLKLEGLVRLTMSTQQSQAAIRSAEIAEKMAYVYTRLNPNH